MIESVFLVVVVACFLAFIFWRLPHDPVSRKEPDQERNNRETPVEAKPAPAPEASPKKSKSAKPKKNKPAPNSSMKVDRKGSKKKPRKRKDY